MSDLLEIDWRDSEVGIDHIPWRWFDRTGRSIAQRHTIFVPATEKICSARCDVDVKQKEAVLDYTSSDRTRKFNERNDVELGLLKIAFTSSNRKNVSAIYWAPRGCPYKKWNVGVARVPEIEPDDPDLISAIGKEGRARLVQHLRRERDPSIVKKKKEAVRTAKGRLVCEACGFDFSRWYRDIGEGFCEVHHRKELAASSKQRGTLTSLEDLAILCSNCHRMIHRTKPMESVPKFRRRLMR